MEREQTTVRLPIELMEKLQKQADEMGISFNALALMILKESVENVNHQK